MRIWCSSNNPKCSKAPTGPTYGMDTIDIGVLQWFHYQDHDTLERAIVDLKALGVTHLRTGISWCDYVCYTEGKEWIAHLFERLGAHFTLLPCLTFTPTALGTEPHTTYPPRRLEDFADFVERIIADHGEHFTHIQLWNEPNNDANWQFRVDPEWKAFSEMLTAAAERAKALGKTTVLGGISPVDPRFIRLLQQNGALTHIDIIGIHHFFGVFEESEEWSALAEKVREIKEVSGKEVWIDEIGYACSGAHGEEGMLRAMAELLEQDVGRAYWYSLYDLPSSRETQAACSPGATASDHDYYFGLKDERGRAKLLWDAWNRGLDNLVPLRAMERQL